VAYISTRYYRAPELLLCSENYGPEIDLWAAGCVMAEMLLGGKVLFPGKNNADQLAKVMMVLGSPTEG
jgi:serine/threonine protein kinase